MSPAAKPDPESTSTGHTPEETLKHKQARTQVPAFGGLFTALLWLALVAATLLPTVSLSMRFFGALILLVACLRLGMTGGLCVYLASLCLSLIYPGLLSNLPFTIYFGPYVLLVFGLSRKWQGNKVIVLRVVLGALLFCLLASLYGDTFLPATYQSRFHDYFWFIVMAVGLIGTAVYDYVLGMAATVYARFSDRF